MHPIPLLRTLLIIMLVVGSVAPVMGTIFLFHKDQSKTTVSLMFANIASLLMNGCYAMALWSGNIDESQMAMKMQYVGNVFFIVFFILFLSYYLRTNYLKIVFPIWTVLEAISLFMMIINDPARLMLEREEFRHINTMNMDILIQVDGPVSKVRYGLVIFIIMGCLITTAVRFFGSAVKNERRNYKRIAAAEIIILLASIVKISLKFSIDIVPISMSIAIFIIDFGLIRGGLLRVTDMGRQWIFENGKTVYIIVDSVYRFLDCNEAAKVMFPSLRTLMQERVLPNEIRHILFDSPEDDIEIEGRKYNRQVIKMNQDDSVMGYTILLNDVTERLKLMEDLREEKERADEANRAKSNFVSTISHEIRTPMNAIVGITDILLRKKRDKEDTDYLMNIKSSGDALLLIINDILDYSKIEAGQMNVVNAEYVPQVMLSDMHMIFVTRIGSKPIELKYEIMEDLPGVLYGDALRIRQIIINFMNNAIKFTDQGTVTLSVRALKEEEEAITLEFSVTDTGLGIKEEDIGKLFSSFSQVDEKKNHSKEGTGLGLAICKQLAELMGGYVGVESSYGQGSRFYAVIPQKIIDRKPADNIERKIEADFDFCCPNVKLLLVDDNEMNLKVAKGLLEPLRMDIDTAMNGKQAVEMVASKKYDVVLMDHMMPIMDGVEATSKIRIMEDEYFKKLPIIALSANVTEEARIEFDECGMNAFVAKPIKMKEVCDALRKFIPESKIEELTDSEEVAAVSSEGAEDSYSEVLKELRDLASYEAGVTPLHVEEGIESCGGQKLYVNLLGDFYKYIDMKSTKIEKCLSDHMIRDYTVEVHALKNTARMIGALELSDEFKHLEELGNKEDEDEIIKLTPGVLDRLRCYKTVLSKFAGSSNDEKKDASMEELIDLVGMIKTAMDTFDLDAADEVVKKLIEYKIPDKLIDKVNELDALVADVAIEESMALCDLIADELKK